MLFLGYIHFLGDYGFGIDPFLVVEYPCFLLGDQYLFHVGLVLADMLTYNYRNQRNTININVMSIKCKHIKK